MKKPSRSKVLVILQARVSSARLPGKVLSPVLGVPMLFRQIERVQRCKDFNSLVVATSTDSVDTPLAEQCRERSIEVYRGSLDDVLSRFYYAALEFGAETIVRLTGDCPLVDPLLMSQMIQKFHSSDYDYMSNGLEPTYPDGLDLEVLSFSCLKAAWERASLHSEREHVTSYIYKNSSVFSLGSIKGESDLSHLRWTVDYPEDLRLIRAIYEGLYPQNSQFNTQDILEFLKQNPDVSAINLGILRNEGYFKSLKADLGTYLTKEREDKCQNVIAAQKNY